MPKSLSMLKKTEDNVGREIDVKIIKLDNAQGVLVSRKHFLDERDVIFRDKINAWVEESKVVDCHITKVTNFGVFVSVNGVSGMIRYNEISHRGNLNPQDSFKVNEEIQAQVIGFDEERKTLQLSRKTLLEDPWDSIDSKFKVGDIIKGEIVNIQKYGAFINLIGEDVDGFLHASEISWEKHLKNDLERFQVGQEIEVKIIHIDKEKKQIKLSLKQISQNPFLSFVERYEVGDIVEGDIVHITNFGAFLFIDCIDCILPNVNCSWDRADTCKKIFKVGEKLQVRIDEIDKDKEKIIVSKKALMDSPTDKFNEKYNIGSIFKGKISAIKDFGLFVNVDDLIDVFIPMTDIEPLNIQEAKEGDEVEATIIQINRKTGKVKGSIRQLERSKKRQDLQEHLESMDSEQEVLNPMQQALQDLMNKK